MTTPLRRQFHLPDLASTQALATRFAACARPGLTMLLSGAVGAGKTTFARHLIQTCLQQAGSDLEDVPSPSFTLVQSYQAGTLEIWHADLYRLTSVDELVELGLEDAFQDAFCLVEWPDRLGTPPPHTIELELRPTAGSETERLCTVTTQAPALADILAQVTPA